MFVDTGLDWAFLFGCSHAIWSVTYPDHTTRIRVVPVAASISCRDSSQHSFFSLEPGLGHKSAAQTAEEDGHTTGAFDWAHVCGLRP